MEPFSGSKVVPLEIPGSVRPLSRDEAHSATLGSDRRAFVSCCYPLHCSISDSRYAHQMAAGRQHPASSEPSAAALGPGISGEMRYHTKPAGSERQCDRKPGSRSSSVLSGQLGLVGKLSSSRPDVSHSFSKYSAGGVVCLSTLFVLVSSVTVDSMELAIVDSNWDGCQIDLIHKFDFLAPTVLVFQWLVPMCTFIIGIAVGRCSRTKKGGVDVAVQCSSEEPVASTKDLRSTSEPLIWVTKTGVCYHNGWCRTLTKTRKQLRPCLVCGPALG